MMFKIEYRYMIAIWAMRFYKPPKMVYYQIIW